MMNVYLLLVVLTFLSAPAVAVNKGYYREDGTEIRYYLDNADAIKLLVIFQGSDCMSTVI